MRPFYLAVFCLFAGVFAIATAQDAADYEKLRKEAEALCAEGSYGRAHEIYLQADALDLPEAEARWVDFRVADTMWRSAAASKTADSTRLDKARRQLDVLVRDIERIEDRDRVWVEVQESLGDYWWGRRQTRNWGKAWPYYQRALDHWAGAEEIDEARERYLRIVWKIAKPRGAVRYYYYGYYGNILPIQILENVLKIAQTENDRAHAHYLIAMGIRYQGGDWGARQRILEEFEAALKGGKATEWHDDALYHYAEWMASHGRAIPLENGQWTQKPDYRMAVKLYKRLLKQYRKGETRYFDDAKSRIQQITRPVVGVGVSNIFLPGSEIRYHLSWRNVKRVDLSLYPVDLSEDVSFAGKDKGSGAYLHTIDLAGREKVASWSHETHDKGDHWPGQETLRLEEPLPTGAYVLEARAEGMSSRDLILVTDASVVVKTSGKRAIVYVCNTLEGSPLAGASVKLWARRYDGKRWYWEDHDGTAGDDGLAVFDVPRDKKDRYSRDLFISATLKDRQSFCIAGSYHYGRSTPRWRIYAFTDRPAYRPKETARWKFVARRHDGAVFTTPAGEAIVYEITDPRGAKVKEGEAKLNPFGSAWGTLELTETMPLGEYLVQFWSPGRKDRIGRATLFRVEEYKLPEFQVTIQTAEEDGKKKSFRLGDKVEVEIAAAYYFGGPVAKATVEVLVYQNPFYHWWRPPRQYPWFYEDIDESPWRWWGGGQLLKRETLKTDAEGKARLSFETPRNAQQDFEYRIEARVTDASRREIVGSDSVRVTRQRYHVYLRPRHYLYRPQDKVSIDIKTLDANEQPVQVTGTMTVTREWWYEIWIDPDGKEVKGEELERVRREVDVFPPPPRDPGGKGWKLKFRGYERDEILQRPVKTNAEGEAEFTFVPEREGYYRAAWNSKDDDGTPIHKATTIWVATRTSRDLGYHQGGVEIIVDRDTFRAGQKAPVMVSVPTNDRYVLFSVEGEDLYSYRLVHVEGTAKLIELEIDEMHVPNVYLSAAMVSGRQMFHDIEQVVVPPVRHFLEVALKCDRDVYQPREKGTLTVVTRDHDGKPVSAEVAIGLVDESVYYIQQDYAGDPRQFYYGQKRGHWVQTHSTFQQKGYIKLIEGKDKELIEATWAAARDGDDYGVTGGAGFARGKAGEGGGGPAAAPEESGLAFEEREMMNGAAAPGAPRPTARRRMDRLEKKAKSEDGGEAEPAVQVRTDFRSTVLWKPDVVTDLDGYATVEVTFPDSLTGWKATARVLTQENQFGIETAATRTRKPLIARLQAPRFFVVGDSVTISAVVNNNTDEPMTVTPSLQAEGVSITGIISRGKKLDREHGPVTVPANGETRFDWDASILRPGVAKLTVVADGGDHTDAMQKSYLIYEHGIEKFVSKSVKLRGEDVTVRIDIPKERKAESTTLTVQVAPSMAVTMLDALPYLIDYPYGCTEQTMSRFLPAAITAKTLKDLGIEPETVMGKVFGGIVEAHEKKTHPGGKKDLEKLDDMVKKGLERLYDFQHGDGGWGWWKGGQSDHFMTAYVVWGLSLAKTAGIQVRDDVIKRGAKFLDKEIVEEEENPDMQAWMLHAMAVHSDLVAKGEPGEFQGKAFDRLWKNKDDLNAYTRALLALSAHHMGKADEAKTLARNLENGVKIDKTPDTSIIQRGKQESQEAVIGTAHWGEDGIYWRWSNGGVEATSFALRALLAIDPENDLIEPVTNWLVKNRRGSQWKSTRDTAITVLALNDYLRQSGELKPNLEYELMVNGQSVAERRITMEDALTAPSRFAIDRELIQDGTNEIRIVRKDGDGAIYFSAEAIYFSLEEPVTPAGNEIFVRRQYYKLVGRPTLLKGYVYHKEPLNDGDDVTSGERVQAVITIEGKNNYEYLVFEDLKPAGLEAVQIRSGEPLYARELKSGAAEKQYGEESRPGEIERIDYTGRNRWVYQELRDRKVALFVDKLPEGYWQIRYDLRAEVPGKFHALPVKGYAMYVPEIRCNGAEARITVQDKPVEPRRKSF